ncbi:hypothetical protein APA_3117 [Pseudanabaena sp. lw0831]|nr:hypothetical protein APA_3117 [Pseudanabaena sp. lw0831]
MYLEPELYTPVGSRICLTEDLESIASTFIVGCGVVDSAVVA